jgi:cruciform cutting endonuclease 1
MSQRISLRKALAGELRQLALSCGLLQSGTKNILRDRIREAARNHKPLKDAARVLSIDLGVRNLAFSLLTLPASTSYVHHNNENITRKRGSSPKKKEESIEASLFHVHAWQRLALMNKPSIVNELADGAPEDDFSPSGMSQATLRLVHELLLPLRPTHIIIERQRFRSGGASTVFEWTLRVNMLEGMLHAIFATLKQTGDWAGDVVPISILPQHINRFLVPTEARTAKDEQEDAGTGSRQRVDMKKEKINLLSGWLGNQTVVNLASDEAKDTAAQFMARWERKNSRQKGKEKKPSTKEDPTMASTMPKKLDDLADCLLQGVAWLQWQKTLDQLPLRIEDLEDLEDV